MIPTKETEKYLEHLLKELNDRNDNVGEQIDDVDPEMSNEKYSEQVAKLEGRGDAYMEMIKEIEHIKIFGL